MAVKIYLIAGILFEAFVLWDYFRCKVPYTKAEIVFGAIIDIVAWPIVLLANIIDWGR